MAFNPVKESVSFVRVLNYNKKEQDSTIQKPIIEAIRAGDHCNVAGWGSTRPFYSVSGLDDPTFPSRKLQVTEVSIWPYKMCFDNYENARNKSKALADALKTYKVNLRNLCANGYVRKKDQLNKNACKVTTTTVPGKFNCPLTKHFSFDCYLGNII